MLPRVNTLLIVSDIHGTFLPIHITCDFAPEILTDHTIHHIDCLGLTGIENEHDVEERHRYFIQTGIDKAAHALLSEYPDGIQIALGLSIGGVILWRAINLGLVVDQLICFSSTRLRYEEQPLKTNTTLYFGENDQHRPDQAWFNKLNINEHIVKGGTHEFYRTKEGTDIFTRELRRQIRPITE